MVRDGEAVKAHLRVERWTCLQEWEGWAALRCEDVKCVDGACVRELLAGHVLPDTVGIESAWETDLSTVFFRVLLPRGVVCSWLSVGIIPRGEFWGVTSDYVACPAG